MWADLSGCLRKSVNGSRGAFCTLAAYGLSAGLRLGEVCAGCLARDGDPACVFGFIVLGIAASASTSARVRFEILAERGQ